MLRLPPYRYHRPTSVEEATSLLGELGADAMPVAGGTDLLPNMKHGLFRPSHVVSLNAIPSMRGIHVEGDVLRIGALETLADVAASEPVRRTVPGLAEAAGLVAGPQLRNMGTIGGNLCLDTRCTYYNQTEFWRRSLGYCLKKDGTVCHVTKVGKKCVAAHSADTPGMLMALEAHVTLAAAGGTRSLDATDLFVADGIWNTRREPGEILTEIRIPVRDHQRSAYVKLRQRNSIDFPLLSVAVAGEVDGDGTLIDLRGVVSALGARPRILAGWREQAAGRALDGDLIASLAERAAAQCRPLENIIVDAEWRRAMVPVYVRRALREMASPA